MIDMYIIAKLEISSFRTYTTQEYTLLSDLLFIFIFIRPITNSLNDSPKGHAKDPIKML